MDNEKASVNNKKNIYLAVIVILILVGVGYFYFGLSKIGQNSSGTTGNNANTSGGGCVCAWNNNHLCGGSSECIAPSGGKSWEKICECSPSGCGLQTGTDCNSFPEGTLACTSDVC